MKNRLGKAYNKLILVICLLSVALIGSSCQSQEPRGVIIEQQAGFGVSYQSMAEIDLGILPPVPGSPEFNKPAEYAILGTVKNVGGDGAITVIASLAVEGYGTQTNAQRVYLKRNQEERVYFEFISKRGYRHSPKIWVPILLKIMNGIGGDVKNIRTDFYIKESPREAKPLLDNPSPDPFPP